jgi:hypothetical protein
MATWIKPPRKPFYDQAFYAWSKAQADLLRAGRYADLDLDHLIEEVDDFGREPLPLGALAHPHDHRAPPEA